MKIIVPSAKLIPPELQSIGKIPAIIYPINQNISFDFIKLKYDSAVAEIDIICFEAADKIKEKLANYKLAAQLNFIELDKLQDLGYSVYCGLTEKDTDVIINFADTIVLDSLPLDEKNFFCSSQEYSNETWTFFKMNDGRLTEINDKKFPSSSFENIKADFFVGVFKISDGAYFKKCLETAFKNPAKNMDSFYFALQIYSETYKFYSCKVKDWFDIGHVRLYFKTRMEVKARAFNRIEIDKNRGILKKTSSDVEKFIGEIKWYLKLPLELEYVRPRIFNYSLHYSQPYVCMEYYSYRTLHELFVYGDLSGEQWKQIFGKIKFVLDDFSRYNVTDANFIDALSDMYLEKTLRRLEKLRTQAEFKNLFEFPICIDGVKYPSLEKIMTLLKNIVPRLLYNVNTFSIIHGDFCFPNVMIDDNFNFIKLIDPRGKFGKYDIYGDSRYEIAKLLHSIEGKYDFIIKDLFELETDGANNFKLNILEFKRNFDLAEIFYSVFKNELAGNLKEIRLIEALLFFSMIPLHKENLNRQYAMLCTGIKIFNDIISTGA